MSDGLIALKWREQVLKGASNMQRGITRKRERVRERWQEATFLRVLRKENRVLKLLALNSENGFYVIQFWDRTTNHVHIDYVQGIGTSLQCTVHRLSKEYISGKS